MQWFYAENNEQRGPVDDAAFQALIDDGTIKPETLVWNETLPKWVPLAEVAGAAADATLEAPEEPGTTVCTECGKRVAEDEVIALQGRNVCADCKALVLQRLSEGAQPARGPTGLEVDEQTLLARPYQVEIGSAFERAWSLFTQNAGGLIGVSLLAGAIWIVGLVVSTASSMVVPLSNYVLQPLVFGPLVGGYYWYLLRLYRGQSAEVGDMFAGFQSRFAPLFLLLLVQNLLMLACMIPVGIIAIAAGLSFRAVGTGQVHDVGALSALTLLALGIVIFVGLAVSIYLYTLFTYGIILVMDKGMPFWPAMMLSRKMVSKGWWITFLLLIIMWLLTICGTLLCCIGLLVAAPVACLVKTIVYDDNFRDLKPNQS